MRTCMVVSLAWIVMHCGCSDESSPTSAPLTTKQQNKVTDEHEQITKSGIIADFVSAVSTRDYDGAFDMLHPILAEAWTKEGFAQDWITIREQLDSRWQPTAMSSFSGKSAQGPYDQATFRLEQNIRSTASMEVISMEHEGAPRLTKLHVRMPAAATLPPAVAKQADAFAAAMQNEDYAAVQSLISPTARQQFKPAVLRQIRLILGDSAQGAIRRSYRLCANTVWYDAVMFAHPNDPAAYLEIILSETSNEIVTLSFKGRVKFRGS